MKAHIIILGTILVLLLVTVMPKTLMFYTDKGQRLNAKTKEMAFTGQTRHIR